MTKLDFHKQSLRLTASVQAHSAWLRGVAAASALVALGACGTTSGGGGGVVYSGGVAGTQCDTALNGQGCLAETAGFSVMQCTGGLWTKVATCAATQYCLEEGSAAQRTASCKSTAAGGDATATGDASPSDATTSGGDGSVIDVSVIDPADTAAGTDAKAGIDSQTGGDVALGMCGNLMCESGEDAEQCPLDCSETNLCVWDACPNETAACQANPGCIGGVQCVSQCQDEACYNDCLSQFPNFEADIADFDACAADSGCDGGSTTGDQSCADSCTDGENGGCYCDTECTAAGDCCSDYTQYCGGGGSTDMSCADSCTDGDNGGCYCDESCTEYGDCCSDFAQYCAAP